MKPVFERKPLGRTGLSLPPVVFGSSCLGNLYRALPYERKQCIVKAWFDCMPAPVVIDSAGKYGAGLALECLGRALAGLGAAPADVIISNKLGWKRVALRGSEPGFEPGAWIGLEHDAEQRIGRDGILECWEQGNRLLGGGYRPALVSVHDPDEYLAAAAGPRERERRFAGVVEAYRALAGLKRAGEVRAIGVGAKDWRVIRELAAAVELDWAMFACAPTVHHHPADLIEFMSALAAKGVAIVNSAVFNGGFLVGGDFYNYRKVSPSTDPALFLWRERFFAVCSRHRVAPADACAEFALSAPGVAAVALNTSDPARVADNVSMAARRAPGEFWLELKREGLIDSDYAGLGV